MAVSLQSATDYSQRRGQLSAYGRAKNSSIRLQWLTLLVCVVTAVPLLAMAVFYRDTLPVALLLIVIFIAFAILVGHWLICRYTHKHFIEPDLAFRKWLQQVCDGELGARIELTSDHRHYKELNFHTQNLTSALSKLSNDMELLVDQQTNRLEEQKRVLELLFRLTAEVSNTRDESQVVETTCRYLSEWFESASVDGYLADASTHLLKKVPRAHFDASGEHSDSRVDGNKPDLLLERDLRDLEESTTGISYVYNQTYSKTEIRVPFYEGIRIAGLVRIVTPEKIDASNGQTHQILTTLSEQLSLFYEKSLATEQANDARMINDRTKLAAEVHDSIAQTLLATRYQASLLLEKINDDPGLDCRDDVLKIKHSIDEANQDIRGLMREYRRPLTEHRYADSLQTVIDEFDQTSGAQVFFQTDDPQITFTPREESVLHKIIGEALTNAKKYAEASTVRIYLQRNPTGLRTILVEDDGVGFSENTDSTQNSDHIGLSIMRERALNIGAKFSIDSEPGEGTRISVVLPPLAASTGRDK